MKTFVFVQGGEWVKDLVCKKGKTKVLRCRDGDEPNVSDTVYHVKNNGIRRDGKIVLCHMHSESLLPSETFKVTDKSLWWSETYELSEEANVFGRTAKKGTYLLAPEDARFCILLDKGDRSSNVYARINVDGKSTHFNHIVASKERLITTLRMDRELDNECFFFFSKIDLVASDEEPDDDIDLQKLGTLHIEFYDNIQETGERAAKWSAPVLGKRSANQDGEIDDSKDTGKVKSATLPLILDEKQAKMEFSLSVGGIPIVLNQKEVRKKVRMTILTDLFETHTYNYKSAMWLRAAGLLPEQSIPVFLSNEKEKEQKPTMLAKQEKEQKEDDEDDDVELIQSVKREKKNHFFSECILCFENQKDCLFKPCNHIATCRACVEKVKSTCPVCLTLIVSTERVYIS